MNLRELWDTVVLRESLGYIFPGCISLLAVALLLRDLEVVDIWNALGVCPNKGLAGLILLPVNKPWMLLVITPLAYTVGHLQSWIADVFEGKLPCSNLGTLALDYLMDEKNRRRYDYAGAAFQVLGVPPGRLPATTAHTSLRDWIKKVKDKQSNGDTPRLCKDQCDHREEEAARDQAYELWRLCDYYLIARAPKIHSVYAGRYYVLTVMFTDLGLSTTPLGLILIAPVIRSAPGYAPLTLALLGSMPVVLLLWCWPCRKPLRMPRFPSWYIQAWEGLFVVTLIGLSAHEPMLYRGWLPLALGLLLLDRSITYRKNFVERVFPIFYAVTQPNAEHAHQE